MNIAEETVQARVGHACSRCTSSGCSDYANRPLNPCQTFMCAWRSENNPMVDLMRPDLSGVIVVMDRLTWRGEFVIVGIPTGERIPEKSLKYLLGLSELMRSNLLTVQFQLEDGKFNGLSRIALYGEKEFAQDMKERFKDGKLNW